MGIYQTKIKKLSGTSWADLYKKALILYRQIQRKTKRRPYIRSLYFNKDKIFLELFWRHLFEKENMRDKTRRIKYFPCAIDLIQHSRIAPESKDHPHNTSQRVYRFTGMTKNMEVFCVQIKEDKASCEKWLMSIFPYHK